MVNNGGDRFHRNVGTALSVKTALLTHWLTPCSSVLLQKLTGSQLLKKFPAFHGTRNFYYRFYKCPLPVPTLSQFNPINAPQSNFPKIHLSNIIPSTLGSYPQVSHQNPARTSPLPHTCYMHRPPNSSRFDNLNNNWLELTELHSKQQYCS